MSICFGGWHDATGASEEFVIADSAPNLESTLY
jgi:hypothetical protein